MSKVEALALNDKIHDFLRYSYQAQKSSSLNQFEKGNYAQFIVDNLKVEEGVVQNVEQVTQELVQYSK